MIDQTPEETPKSREGKELSSTIKHLLTVKHFARVLFAPVPIPENEQESYYEEVQSSFFPAVHKLIELVGDKGTPSHPIWYDDPKYAVRNERKQQSPSCYSYSYTHETGQFPQVIEIVAIKYSEGQPLKADGKFVGNLTGSIHIGLYDTHRVSFGILDTDQIVFENDDSATVRLLDSPQSVVEPMEPYVGIAVGNPALWINMLQSKGVLNELQQQLTAL